VHKHNENGINIQKIDELRVKFYLYINNCLYKDGIISKKIYEKADRALRKNDVTNSLKRRGGGAENGVV